MKEGLVQCFIQDIKKELEKRHPIVAFIIHDEDGYNVAKEAYKFFEKQDCIVLGITQYEYFVSTSAADPGDYLTHLKMVINLCDFIYLCQEDDLNKPIFSYAEYLGIKVINPDGNYEEDDR